MPVIQWLPLLVADPRARRAVEETVLDVRTEREHARTAGARLRWRVRSAIAIALVMLRVLPYEARALAVGGWLWTVAAWVGVLTAIIAVQPVVHVASWEILEWKTRAILVAVLLPAALAVTLPIAAFFAALWPRRTTSSVVAQAAGTVLLAVVAVQSMPAANQAFRRTVAVALDPARRVEPARGTNELTLTELARAAFVSTGAAGAGSRFRVRLSRDAGLVAVAGAFSLLGALLAGPGRGRRVWPFALAIPILFVLVPFWASALTALALSLYVVRSHHAGLPGISPTR
jgi:hypothetical protein